MTTASRKRTSAGIVMPTFYWLSNYYHVTHLLTILTSMIGGCHFVQHQIFHLQTSSAVFLNTKHVQILT